jgi:hypothetical protein
MNSMPSRATASVIQRSLGDEGPTCRFNSPAIRTSNWPLPLGPSSPRLLWMTDVRYYRPAIATSFTAGFAFTYPFLMHDSTSLFTTLPAPMPPEPPYST